MAYYNGICIDNSCLNHFIEREDDYKAGGEIIGEDYKGRIIIKKRMILGNSVFLVFVLSEDIEWEEFKNILNKIIEKCRKISRLDVHQTFLDNNDKVRSDLEGLGIFLTEVYSGGGKAGTMNRSILEYRHMRNQWSPCTKEDFDAVSDNKDEVDPKDLEAKLDIEDNNYQKLDAKIISQVYLQLLPVYWRAENNVQCAINSLDSVINDLNRYASVGGGAVLRSHRRNYETYIPSFKKALEEENQQEFSKLFKDYFNNYYLDINH